MSQKVAVVIVHGICMDDDFDEAGNSKYAQGMAQALKLKIAEMQGCSGSESEKLEWANSKVAIAAVNWSPILLKPEKKLYHNINIGKLNDFLGLRQFVFRAIADSLTYQITGSDTSNRWSYDEIHRCFAETLQKLADSEAAGAQAPLCIISHSFGTVIASNYIYDLQNTKAKIEIGDTPLERGETLTSFYTLASQIPFWSLRHGGFDRPITVPATQLEQYYPDLAGEWLNFYNKNDLLAYPLKPLNEAYSQAVTEDREVKSGDWLKFWNPASHAGYWTNKTVLEAIAKALTNISQKISS